MYGKSKPRLCRQLTRRLIEKGADLSWVNPNENGNTIVMFAIENKYLECVEYLSSMQWNGNVTRNDGSNSFLLCLKHDFPQSVTAKIASRTKNLNVTNKFGDNSLQLARNKQMEEIVSIINNATLNST